MKRRYVDIVYEDRDLIVVNKPRGITVLEEDRQGTLTGDIRAYLMRKYSGARGAFIRPLHRLDKETTGLVIFAASKNGLKLVEDIKSHKARRIYLAVVEGAIPNEEDTINVPLEKGDFGFGKKV